MKTMGILCASLFLACSGGAKPAPQAAQTAAVEPSIEPVAAERQGDDAAMPAQKIRHPRNVRILPASRDFH